MLARLVPSLVLIAALAAFAGPAAGAQTSTTQTAPQTAPYGMPYGMPYGGMMGAPDGRGGYGPGPIGRDGRSGGHMRWDDDDDGVHGAMMLFVLVLVAAAIAAVVLFFTRRPAGPASTATALEILEQRFARGEIDADEFAARRSALTGSG